MWARLNDSETGQIVFDPKPRASRWYGVRPFPFPPTEPPPEKTVTIVTFCPSSRRLAISPPQESATSSGCGATKTCVMAPESSSRSRREAALADQRHERDGAVVAFDPVVAVARHDQEVLPVARPDRQHQSPARRIELLPQRIRDRRRRRCDEDRP